MGDGLVAGGEASFDPGEGAAFYVVEGKVIEAGGGGEFGREGAALAAAADEENFFSVGELADLLDFVHDGVDGDEPGSGCVDFDVFVGFADVNEDGFAAVEFFFGFVDGDAGKGFARVFGGHGWCSGFVCSGLGKG